MSAFEAGLATLPAAAAMIAITPAITPLAGKIGGGRAVALGFALATLGFAVLAFVEASWTYAAFVGPLLVLSVGLGLANGPASSGSTAAVSRRPGRLRRGDLEHGALRRRRRAVAAIAMVNNAVANNHKEAGESAADALAAGLGSCALMMAIWSRRRRPADPPDARATARPARRPSSARPPRRPARTRSRSTRVQPATCDDEKERRCPLMTCAGRQGADGPGEGRPRRARRVPVGRRPEAVPAGGVREGGAVGRRRVRRRRAAGRAACRRPPTARTACTATRPAPEGAPTVLLYCHYDVQPPLGEDAWDVPVFELTERDGRWYGRGTADCKGNIVMHLTALRALQRGQRRLPVRRSSSSARAPRSRAPAGWRRSCPTTSSCCAPTRSSSSTPATSRSASRRSRRRCAA